VVRTRVSLLACVSAPSVRPCCRQSRCCVFAVARCTDRILGFALFSRPPCPCSFYKTPDMLRVHQRITLPLPSALVVCHTRCALLSHSTVRPCAVISASSEALAVSQAGDKKTVKVDCARGCLWGLPTPSDLRRPSCSLQHPSAGTLSLSALGCSVVHAMISGGVVPCSWIF
jgi:hypothetical protein